MRLESGSPRHAQIICNENVTCLASPGEGKMKGDFSTPFSSWHHISAHMEMVKSYATL